MSVLEWIWLQVSPLVETVLRHPARWWIIGIVFLIGFVGGLILRYMKTEDIGYYGEYDKRWYVAYGFGGVLFVVFVLFLVAFLLSLLLGFLGWLQASWTVYWTMVFATIGGVLLGMLLRSQMATHKLKGARKEAAELRTQIQVLEGEIGTLEDARQSANVATNQKVREADELVSHHKGLEYDAKQAVRERNNEIKRLKGIIERGRAGEDERAQTIKQLKAEKAEIYAEWKALKYPEDTTETVYNDFSEFVTDEDTDDGEND